MAQRVIACKVVDDYITGDGVTIGGAGSHDEVLLELDFRAADNVWRNTVRTAVFRDARGQNPVAVLLSAAMRARGQTDIYYVPVPIQAKAYPGEMTVTVYGTESSGGTEVLKAATGDARFRVLDNAVHRWEGTDDVPASAAEQIQAEILALRDLFFGRWTWLEIGEDGYLYEIRVPLDPIAFSIDEIGRLEVEFPDT